METEEQIKILNAIIINDGDCDFIKGCENCPLGGDDGICQEPYLNYSGMREWYQRIVNRAKGMLEELNG